MVEQEVDRGLKLSKGFEFYLWQNFSISNQQVSLHAQSISLPGTILNLKITCMKKLLSTSFSSAEYAFQVLISN